MVFSLDLAAQRPNFLVDLHGVPADTCRVGRQTDDRAGARCRRKSWVAGTVSRDPEFRKTFRIPAGDAAAASDRCW